MAADSPRPSVPIYTAANNRNTVSESPCTVAPCVVCCLRAALEDDDLATDFATENLTPNLVGVRTFDSVSNAFDDQMYVVIRPLARERMAELTTRVQPELLASLEAMRPHLLERMRVVACSIDRAVWLVFRAEITTDPGLDHKVLRKSISATELAEITTEVASIEAEIARLGKQGAVLKSKRRKLAHLQQKIKDQKEIQATQAAEIITQEGNEARLPSGRAMLQVGDYQKDFRFDIHGQSKFDRCHTALVSVRLPVIRHYRASHLPPPIPATKPGGTPTARTLKVCYHYPDGGSACTEPDDMTVLGPPANVLRASANDAGAPLSPRDVFGIHDLGSSINIHRAHHVTLDAKGNLRAVQEFKRVGDFSEGCQTFPRDADFSAFIRLMALSKQFECRAGAQQGCGRIVPSIAGQASSVGEQALVERFTWLTMAARVLKEERSGLTEDERKKIEQYITSAEAARKAMNEARKALDLAKRRAKPSRGKSGKAAPKPPSPALVKAQAAAQEIYEKTRQTQTQALTPQDPAVLTALQNFVRRRSAILGADFLSLCDVRQTCSRTFRYRLTEAEKPIADAMETAWRTRSTPWNGAWVLGSTPPPPAVPPVVPSGPVAPVSPGGCPYCHQPLDSTRWRRIFPAAKGAESEEARQVFNQYFARYELGTCLRRAHFFAQVREEVGVAMTPRYENFNYSAEHLVRAQAEPVFDRDGKPKMKTFKTKSKTGKIVVEYVQAMLPQSPFAYFRGDGLSPPEKASRAQEAWQYGRRIENGKLKKADWEAIANRVYANRKSLGNGDVASGDGWRYRGAGFLQLTGKTNYLCAHQEIVKRSPDCGVNVADGASQVVLSYQAMMLSAMAFWTMKSMYTVADQGSSVGVVDSVTKIVNASTPSKSERQRHFAALVVALELARCPLAR